LQGNTEVQGSIDELMVRMPYLELIDISSTGMEGTIPTEVQMSNLRFFRVWNGKLSGTIPTEIGAWKNLGKMTTFLISNSGNTTRPKLTKLKSPLTILSFCFPSTISLFRP
jgi:hypothetical protein